MNNAGENGGPRRPAPRIQNVWFHCSNTTFVSNMYGFTSARTPGFNTCGRYTLWALLQCCWFLAVPDSSCAGPRRPVLALLDRCDGARPGAGNDFQKVVFCVSKTAVSGESLSKANPTSDFLDWSYSIHELKCAFQEVKPLILSDRRECFEDQGSEVPHLRTKKCRHEMCAGTSVI